LFVLGVLVNSPAIVALITFDFIAVMLRLFQSIGSFTGSLTGLVNSQVHLRHFNNFDKNKLKDNRENYIVKSNESENIISINNMSFKYFNSETLIFNNTSIKIRKGEHTIITGPNGSGKSTLLGLIAGVLYPTNGNIEISTRNLGYIGATPLIFTESLKYNLLYGTDKNIDDQKLLQKLKDFEVFKEESGYDLERKITNKTLSSGQMQKVAFIRALISDVEILLLDESTANLDDDSKDKIFSILSDKNITIINSTHDPDSFVNIDNHLKIDIVDEERILKFN
jgi:ABC-type bacteriocin/lantibiotic exporter with double-glycine peptidase domain